MLHLSQPMRSAAYIGKRVDRLAVFAHLEMDVRAGRPSCGADLRDLLACRNRLPHTDTKQTAMCVKGLDSASVVDDDILAVAAVRV